MIITHSFVQNTVYVGIPKAVTAHKLGLADY